MRGSGIRFGVGLPFYGDFNSLMEYALAAEEAGYDSVWMADHVFFPHEIMTTLSAVASRTDRLGLGTSVIDPNRRNPALIAHMAATLDVISGGRLIMGVGRGVWNEASYGYHLDKPVSRMRETIELLKRFWTEAKVDHRGEFFTYEGASISSKPLQKPHPPIWIAGFGPRILRIAGELGDGFITQHLPPEIHEEELEKVRARAREVRRDPSKIVAAMVAPMVVSPDREAARSLIEPGARRSLVRRAGPPVFLARRLGYGTPWDRPEDVPVEVVDRSFIFGNPDDCVEKVEEYVRVGVEYFVALPLMPEGVDGLRLFAEKVVAYFSEGH